MKYIDISSYKAWVFSYHRVQTPFIGVHESVISPVTRRPTTVLYEDGILELCPGLMHDWGSGPTWDDKTNRDPAAEHDALFRLLRNGAKHFTWQQADEFMRDRLIECGMPKWRAWLWWLGRQMPFIARGRQAKPRKEPAHVILDSTK